MADTEFFRTRMGQTFYEGTMPRLVREMEKLNKNLERSTDLKLYGAPREHIKEAMAKIEAMPTFVVPQPTEREPEKFREYLTTLIAKAENSGEAAGRMIGEHLDDMRSEDPNVILSELDNIIEWARQLKSELE